MKDLLTKIDAPTVSDNLLSKFADVLAAPAPAVKVCDYCGEQPATGYVRAYKSHVCEECYVDYHGDID